MKKILNILEYILAIVIILNCRSVYQHATYINFRIEEVTLIIIGILLVIKLGCRMYDVKRTKKAIIFLIIYYMYAILFFLLNSINHINNYIYTFFIVFPSLFVYYYIDKKPMNIIISFLNKICNVIFFIAVISLIIYLTGPVLNIIKPNNTIYISWGGVRKVKSYFGIHFITQRINIFGKLFIRNTSIFTEGPMYSLNLTMALAIEMFILPNKSLLKKIILLITLVTTISSTGIIISSAMIIASILIDKDKGKIKKEIKIILFPTIAIILSIIMLQFFNERTQTKSWAIRIDDYRACYKTWKQNKFLGVGYGNEHEIKQHMSSFRANNKGLSNSILVILAEGGIYLLIIYLISLLEAIMYGIKYNKKNLIVFCLVICILATTTIFHFTILMINLLVMGYVLALKRREENEKI